MKRLVQPELLDALPPDDPRAIRARHDLRRVNAWMRNHSIMARELQNYLNGRCGGRQTGALLPGNEMSSSLPEAATPVRQIVDLGAGDGHFLARVAKDISSRWPGVNAILLDNQKIVNAHILLSFASFGWQAEAVTANVSDWLPATAGLDVAIANLFLHHFDDGRLAGLFRAIAGRARLFVALEPRRAPWPLFCSRWLWAIGCNSVTRHDAVASVRAGFSGAELTALWPDKKNWHLIERRAGPFSHLFVATKIDLKCADVTASRPGGTMTCSRSPR